jgi:hypothetical protein
MFSVPYSVELNDPGIFTLQGLTSPLFVQMVTDHPHQLRAESAGSGRVMDWPCTRSSTARGSGASYLDQALRHVAGHPGVAHHQRRDRRTLRPRHPGARHPMLRRPVDGDLPMTPVPAQRVGLMTGKPPDSSRSSPSLDMITGAWKLTLRPPGGQ